MSFATLDLPTPILEDYEAVSSETCDFEYCRLCASQTPQHLLESFFESTEASNRLLISIRRLNIGIKRQDGLPQSACMECIRLLEAVEVIVRKIANAQKTLETLYKLKKDSVASDSGNENSDVDTTKPEKEQLHKSKKKSDKKKQSLKRAKRKRKSKSTTTLPMYNNVPTTNQYITNDIEPNVVKLHEKKQSMLPLYNSVPTTTDDDDAPVKSEDPAILRWSDFFCCKRCNLNMQTLQQLREHSWQTHSRCVVFKCVTCPGQIVSYKRFFRHMIKHHKSLEQCCEFCNECFVSSSEVRFHKELEHVDEAKTHPCNSCGTTFDLAEELQNHRDSFIIVKAKVAGDRRFKCPQCDKEFLNNITLQSHLESHDPTKNICTICNKTYKNKYNLKQHMSFVHNPQSQFICQICGKSFKRGAMLKEHIAVHKGIRPFTCSICEKKFSKSAALKAHQVSHSGLRPCICKVCGKSYKFKSGLNLHLNTHENIKPYSCDECVKSFQNWSNYNKHMKRIHNKNMSMRQPLERC